MKVNNRNYFSVEADKLYMSVSQYKNFKQCESMAMARINGLYKTESAAFLLGSYVHAWNEGTLDRFKAEHPEIVSSRGNTKGQLKAEFQIGNKMIDALQSDPFIMGFLRGRKEVVMTGELFGTQWKIMIDVYNPNQDRMVDLKTVRSIHEKFFQDGKKLNFIEKYGYITQLAVYQEIETQHRLGAKLTPYIVAVSKEQVPDKAVIFVDDETLEMELLDIETRMERILAVKNGLETPKSCGKCGYCKQVKKIKEAIHYSEL